MTGQRPPFDQEAWDALTERHDSKASSAADDIVGIVRDVAVGDEFCALNPSVQDKVWQKIRIRILEMLQDMERGT